MKKIQNKYHIIFLVFFLYLLAQYHLVYLYFDDFGYCSLSYGYNADITGNVITLSGLTTWLIHSYFLVNGRVFTNLVFAFTAWLGDVHLMRILFPICITSIYYLIYFETFYKLESEYFKIIGAIILVLSYGIFDIRVCKDGLYWFAAAFGYVVPVLFFSFFIKLNRKNSIFQYPIIFLICLSCEQMVAMTFSFLITNIITSFLEKKQINKKNIIALTISVLGGAIMVLSPASRNRINNPGNIAFKELNFLEKILTNVNNIIKIFFNGTGALFVTFLFLLFIIASLYILKMKYNNLIKIENLIYLFVSVIIWFCYKKNLLDFSSRSMCCGLFIYFAFGFINLIILYIQLNKKIISLIVAGMASIGLLLLVPEIPVRTFIPLIFLTIFLLAELVSRIMCKHIRKITYTIIGIPYTLIMILNIVSIYQGYSANVEVLKYNEAKLTEAKVLLQNGIDVTEVQLYRLKNDMYAGAQVYHESASFMKFWVDEYYQLPYEITYVYYDYGTRNNGASICHVK